MWKTIAYRLLQFPLVLTLVYLITFALVWIAPGNPFENERSIAPDVALRPAYDALYDDYLYLYRDSRRVVHRLAGRQGTR